MVTDEEPNLVKAKNTAQPMLNGRKSDLSCKDNRTIVEWR